MSKPKPIRPAEIDPMTQPWHTLVDTLRLLPSVTATARPPHPDPVQELRAAQREKKTLDEALEQITNLIRLRRGDAVPVPLPVPGSTSSESVVVLPSPVVPALATPNAAPTAVASPAGSGVKRKRRGSVSISPAPQSAPMEKTQSLTVPKIEGGARTSVPTPAAGGVPMAPVPSTGVGLGINPGLAHVTGHTGRSVSPLPPPTRSGTPTARQLTGRERKDALADQLPLLKGRRVLFKQPQTAKEKNEDGEEEAWILGTIVECIGGDRNRYTVLDADDSEGPPPKYNTTLRSIIPLPDPSLPLSSSAHPSNIDDYPKGTHVLALYPETTVFYPAKVLVPPSRNKSDPGRKLYRVFFEGDDGGQFKEVAAGDVVLMPGAGSAHH